MSEYQGYEIKQNPDSKRWEIFWKGKRLEGDYASAAAAEDWIDEQFPSHRF